MTAVEIEELVRGGESARLEFKISTGQLTRAAETLCAFLNADGGRVLSRTSVGRISESALRLQVMPQERYQKLLLERAHARQRWENAVTDVEVSGFDSEEILRTVRIGVAAGRCPRASYRELTRRWIGSVCERKPD